MSRSAGRSISPALAATWLFARLGLQDYWVVDPAGRRVEISVLTANGYGAPPIVGLGAVESLAIAALIIPLARIFDRL